MTEIMQSQTAKSVAFILERELDSLTKEWKRQVTLVPSLTCIPLSDTDRTWHLPKLFAEILGRLRCNRNIDPPVSNAPGEHGRLRFLQGYSIDMLVEESRILEVTTFGILQRHKGELDRNQMLSDVAIIADEADRQLGETVVGFMIAGAAA